MDFNNSNNINYQEITDIIKIIDNIYLMTLITGPSSVSGYFLCVNIFNFKRLCDR